VNNNKKNNKVGKYPMAGFFQLVDGFVVVMIAMTEAQKSDRPFCMEEFQMKW
jgi:hypothetical protein